MNQLGKYIKENREKLNISQRELARRINVDNGTIAKIEKGLVKKPNFETLKKINEELNGFNIEKLDNILEMAGYTYDDLINCGYITFHIGIAGSKYLKKYLYEYNGNKFIDIIKALKDYKENKLNESEIIGIFSILTGVDFKKYIPKKNLEKYNIYFIEKEKKNL